MPKDQDPSRPPLPSDQVLPSTASPSAASANAAAPEPLGGVALAPAPGLTDEPDEAAPDEPSDSALARFRHLVEQEVTGEAAERLVAQAGQWLAEKPAARALPPRAPDPSGEPRRVPDGFLIDGRPPDIAIDPGERQFEPVSDWLGWLVHAAPYWPRPEDLEKAPFRWAHEHKSGFIYPLPLRQGRARIALFADFGTGLYHSRYIARHIGSFRPEVAVHLGDIYYAGLPKELKRRFSSVVEPLLGRTQLYALAGNHELLSGGFAYFKYLEDKHKPAPGRAAQPQEGSYFCLRSDPAGPRYQVIGIDTEYFEEGRHRNAALQGWLYATLDHGRRSGYVNILLSSDEPYELGRRLRRTRYPAARELKPLLGEDLAQVVLKERLVDLWFWGNNHYCALFDRNEPHAPFIGSCIGHGGFPYTRLDASAARWDFAPVRFLETAGRFPDWTGLRPDRGNNGFALVTLDPSGVLVEYVDWMKRLRCRARLVPEGGRLTIADVASFPA